MKKKKDKRSGWRSLPLIVRGFIAGNIVYLGSAVIMLLIYLISTALSKGIGVPIGDVFRAWSFLILEITVGIPYFVTLEIFAYFGMTSFGYFLPVLASNILTYGVFGIVFVTLYESLHKKRWIYKWLVLIIFLLPIYYFLFFHHSYQMAEDPYLKYSVVSTCYNSCLDYGGDNIFITRYSKFSKSYKCECRSGGGIITFLHVGRDLEVSKTPKGGQPDEEFPNIIEEWLTEMTMNTYVVAEEVYNIEVVSINGFRRRATFEVNGQWVTLGEWDRVVLDDGAVFGLEYVLSDSLRYNRDRIEKKVKIFLGKK